MKDEIPVLLVIFNRPEHTREVMDALRKIKPTRLFISADGPRKNKSEDAGKCVIARDCATSIDWDCDVQTRFLDENLGCGLGVSSAITWFFQNVEYGIILEDDCVPHPHFFQFCEELFERYAEDTRIMRISGLSPYPIRNHLYDYHFSRRFYCTGWGTWRRAWRHFSYPLEGMNQNDLAQALENYYPFYHVRRPWEQNMARVITGELKTWAIRWDICCFLQNGLTINPEKNLITNIGFGEDATHTHKFETMFANLKTHGLSFPLKHPPFVYHDSRREKDLARALYRELSFKSRIAWHVKRALGGVADYIDTLPGKD